MNNINPKLRVSLYIVVAAAGAVLVTWGVMEQSTVDALAPVIAGVLSVVGGGVAAANTNVKPRSKDPSIIEWARMGQDAIPALLNEIQRERGGNSDDGKPSTPDAGTYSGPSSVPDVTPSVSGLPVWDQPSSIPDEGYTGRHRLGG